jgi:glutamate synthase domain-containing protein 3
MRTGRDVAVAAMLGAEEFGFCTAALITLGCVMLRHCNLNNCSVGVATQDELLQRKFQGRPEYVENYIRFVVKELRNIMAGLGVRKMDELTGRTDLLEVNRAIIPPKAAGIDLSAVLYKPEPKKGTPVYRTRQQDHGIDEVLDRELIRLSKDAIEAVKPVNIELPIKNTNRTTGAMLSGEICHRHGENALPEDTVRCKFTGVAGQSFGAFLAKGVTFELEGLANDYVGKGISGGKIVIYPGKDSTYGSEDNIIIGNTAFYGAISGEAYIRGLAGERFCIRNSGLYAVCEGLGDHGCEYMTGGRVVVLGSTGRNFGAGMSGGIAYIYDNKGCFKENCNMDMVVLEELDEEDKALVQDLVKNHHRFTGSLLAESILSDYRKKWKKFVKVMPLEYKRILESRKMEGDLGLLEVSDG